MKVSREERNTFWLMVAAGAVGWNVHIHEYDWAAFGAILALYFVAMLVNTKDS